MKNLFILFFACYSFSSLHAQENDKKGFITLSGGIAAPFGDFANTSTGNDDAGFALGGGNLNISFGYRLGRNLGVTAMISGASNPLNTESLEDEFLDNYPQASWNVKSDPWKYGALMIGGFATFPVSERGSFDIRLLVGVLSATTPRIDATASDFGVTVSGTREEKTVSTGAFDIGFIFRYRIADPVCILAGIDFLTANPTFENVETTTSFGNSTSDFDQNIRAMNFNLGIGFLLN